VGTLGRVLASPAPHPFIKQTSGQIFKDDVNGFSSTSIFPSLRVGGRKSRGFCLFTIKNGDFAVSSCTQRSF
jgi:hypothetical protein